MGIMALSGEESNPVNRKTILAFVPLPPPYAGPEIATEDLLKGLHLSEGGLAVVKSNVRRANEKKGQLDFAGLWSSAKALFRLGLGCLRYRPHTVYFLLSSSTVGYLRDFMIILISKLFFCKTIAHYRGSNFKKFYERMPGWYQQLIRVGLNKVDIIIVQAERLKVIFEDIYPKSQLRVLYQGVVPKMLDRAGQVRRDESKKERTLLFINHICFTKGFYDLIKAYERLRSNHYPVRLLIAGGLMLNPSTQKEFLSGKALQFYEQNVAAIHQTIKDFVRTDHENRVEYLGIVSGENKYLLYERSDVFVLPSYTEGFSNAMLEAMAFGLPLLVTPVGAVPEVITEGKNALFVEPGNIAMLEKQLERLVSDSDLRRRLGSENYHFARRDFQMDVIQKQFESILLH